jgi:Tfp pilus tip-associated adhesin PilY1
MLKLTTKKAYWFGLISILLIVGAFLKFAFAVSAYTPSTQPVGYVGQDEMTNYDLRSGHEVLFRGQYEKEYWSGNLLALSLNSFGDLATATSPWNGGASFQLELQGADRRIVTLKSDGTKIPFAWGSLSGTQQGYLTSTAVLDYLRGDRTQEIQQGGTFRQRQSALGAIVHSRPYYIADDTNPTVFVGANDGMLHAFNATTGAERWAYVPSMLISKMKNLSTFPFVPDYYVDGSINVANIVNETKRVLVGGLGAGGKGLFALDITGTARLQPADEATAADNILWEISPTAINNTASAAYANLGYTSGYSAIGKVGTTDAVIVGNGYNDGGDYQAYLYVINADTGALISAIKAGTSGSATSPNGLSAPVAIDSDGNGAADTVYAGDLNGTLWKFNLTAETATALLTASPAQPITMTPGVARHPSGGYMVNFATGAILTDADTTDTSTVFAAYGVWDGAPAANTALLAQTLTERCYTQGTAAAPSPCVNRVRTVTSNQPDWSAGTGHHKGWRVPLPASERVLGEGSFIENGRFYFTSHNPTVSTAVQSSFVKGENWLMELDYLTGGAKNSPFLDLSGNHQIDNDDRVKDSTTARDPVLTTDGVPVGKILLTGVMSQPILVQLSSLNNTLFNRNPDIIVDHADLNAGAGVTGGHFDVDIFYAAPGAGAQASATITVGTSGQTSGFPATLGAITVDGVTIVPAMTVADIPDGTATTTNANVIKNKVMNGFTATRTNNVITIKAPAGAQYNGKAISVAAGTSQTLIPAASAIPAVTPVTGVTAVPPTGFITFTGSTGSGSSNNYIINDNLSGSQSIKVGGNNAYANAITVGSSKTAAQAAAAVVAAMGTGGTYKAYVGGSSITPACAGLPNATKANVVCIIDTSTANYGGNNSKAITVGGISNASALTFSLTDTSGGVTGVTAVVGSPAVPAVLKSGWTNFAPALTVTAFNNSGAEPVSNGDSCTSGCKYDQHIHQYDDEFDVTGVNMLNPSDTKLDLKLAIPSLTQNFKVIMQNQYLSPGVKLHIGDPSYLYNVDFGYVSVKDYVTSNSLDLASLQTYRRDPNTVWPGAASTAAAKLAAPKPIGSMAWNMPLDALTAKDWWGNGDIRVGLHPTIYSCVWAAKGANDGNMYQPVIPKVNGVDGPGAAGWSSSTSPTTATGARHNGALVVQIIKDTTPNSAIEQNVAGRPEYGWRVKSALYATYVLAEYATYWHHPNGKCYNSTGWTKTPGADDGASDPSAKAAGSTDPKIGDLSAGGGSGVTIVSVTTTVDGNVTTTVITYSNGSRATIVRTVNTSDGTVTIVTTDALGNTTSQTIANTEGSVTTGGDERGLQARTGRVSWRELVKQ